MKKYIILIMLIMMLSLVVAQPPFQSGALDTGLTIETNQIEYFNTNNDFYLHAHVYDTNTGLLVNNNNLSCEYHLYSETMNWEHVSVGTLENYGAGVFTYINSSNFTTNNAYSIMLWCSANIDDTAKGGFTKFSFYGTGATEKNINTWQCPTTAKPFLIFGLVFVIMFVLALIFKSSVFGILSGLTLLMSYISFGACAPLILSPLLIAGLLITLMFATN